MQVNHFFAKAFRKSLQLFFGFDKWHVSPLMERPYAVDVIEYCNKLNDRNNFAEIGCGLGDITRNVKFERRAGYDMDTKVLGAAKLLPAIGSKKYLSFREFQFPQSELKEKLNVLILVNWIHHIDPALLKQKIAQYFHENMKDGGEIIIDTVQDPAYRYNHLIGNLTNGLNCSVFRLGEYARQRELWAIKKLN